MLRVLELERIDQMFNSLYGGEEFILNLTGLIILIQNCQGGGGDQIDPISTIIELEATIVMESS